MRYHEPRFRSWAATLSMVHAGSTSDIVEAIIGASLGAAAPAWVEALCLDLARTHDHRDVQAAAILGLAHLARRFGRLDDLPSVEALLRDLQDVPELAGRVLDVRSDLAMFLSSLTGSAPGAGQAVGSS